jgi:hypothetical protein
MGIRWQSIGARFKRQLDLTDLHEATDHTFETAASAPGLVEVFGALKLAEPDSDHSHLWRELFSPRLETIAAQMTRESQAVECRRHFLELTDERTIADELLHNKDPAITRMFLHEDDFGIKDDKAIMLLLVKNLLFSTVSKVACIMLHNEQYNGTIELQAFETDYTRMSKFQARFTMAELGHQLAAKLGAKPDGWDRFHLEVMRPASLEFQQILRDYKLNLLRLAPIPPNASAFNIYQIEVMKNLQPNL